MQILTLADITMQNGRTLLPNIRLGVSYRRSSLTWPRQPFVKKILPLWERACTILQNQLYSNTLGHWKSTHQVWDWSTNSNQTVLQHCTDLYTKLPLRGSKFGPDGKGLVSCEEMLPADVLITGRFVKLLSTVITEYNRPIMLIHDY